nr:truncated transposase [Drosophila sturtevanti]
MKHCKFCCKAVTGGEINLRAVMCY